MDTNVAYNNENIALCEIPEAEKLKKQKYSTIGRLFNELQTRLQKELEKNPASEATTEFKKNLEILDKKYKEEITKIVDDYQKEYQSFVEQKLPNAEKQYKKLAEWTNVINNSGEKFRAAIEKLRKESYDQVESALKEEWNNARKPFKNDKCCRNKALELKKIAEQEFENHKKFKETVADWFKDLDVIYKKAEEFFNKENYKAFYAYSSEFEPILSEVRQLKKDETETETPTQNSNNVKDPEWLKKTLTEELRKYCRATYEYFYWENNWIELTEEENKAAQKYQNFKNSRRVKFIREAQDVELPEDDGGC